MQRTTYCSDGNMNLTDFAHKCERAAQHPLMLDLKIRNLGSDQVPVGTLRCFNSSVKNTVWCRIIADAKFHGHCYNHFFLHV